MEKLELEEYTNKVAERENAKKKQNEIVIFYESPKF